MIIWINRLVLLMTFGGAFGGVLAISEAASRSGFSSGWVAVIYGAFLAYFLWGILIGLSIAERRAWRKQLTAFLLLQVPYLELHGFSYKCITAFGVLIGYRPGNVGVHAELTTDIALSFGGGDTTYIAINAVPLVLLTLLWRSNPSLERP